jgi:actin-related protein 6
MCGQLATGSTLCALARQSKAAPCALVLDTGFSFTHAVPHVFGAPVVSAVRRLDLGGKQMTSYLKDIVSYRQLDLSEETWVVNQVAKHPHFDCQ